MTPAEAARIDALSPTHVLEAALWSVEQIHEKAKAAIEYDNAWSPVAD